MNTKELKILLEEIETKIQLSLKDAASISLYELMGARDLVKSDIIRSLEKDLVAAGQLIVVDFNTKKRVA